MPRSYNLFTRVKRYVQECIENHVWKQYIKDREQGTQFPSFLQFFFSFLNFFISWKLYRWYAHTEIFFSILMCISNHPRLVPCNPELPSFFPIFDQASKSSLYSISTPNSNNQSVVQKTWLITFRLGKLR